MKEERSLPQMQCDSALPSELSPLVELMAENVHDVWMRTRTEQGWTYGPERNDAEKKHPCLVPYDQLPEEEKVYDRNTSIETLRFIIDHGFDIRLNPFKDKSYKQIEKRCEAKAAELFEKHFGNLVNEAAFERPETIGDYSLDLPKRIEGEYYVFLKGLWAELAPAGSPPFEEIIDKRDQSDAFTAREREGIRSAYKDALKQTVLERLTKSNHRQVTYYKGLLQSYTKDLLTALQCDFLEDILRYYTAW